MQIYRVGGSVRDELLGRAVADRDYVVVGATPEAMRALGFRSVGRDFPVFLHPQTHDEYALARTERKSGPGHRGFRFHASPDVTLEEDLGRRDLTINAMARAENGTLIDPFGGERDLRAGILRHVGPAFAEDPLRVLRVARFAARFGFAVAPETQALMRSIVAGGELVTLSSERVWQELSRALMDGTPSLFVTTLRRCGALAVVLPELDALYNERGAPGAAHREGLLRALDSTAPAAEPLPVRYAVLAGGLADQPRARSLRAERLSRRLNAPSDCRELALLAARLGERIERAPSLSGPEVLDLLLAGDALRRPGRFERLMRVCAALQSARRPNPETEHRALAWLAAARSVVRNVDAGKLGRTRPDGREVARRLRAERLKALREWRDGTLEQR
ncbi:MAG TPA: multifunctional CCA tRNA nucleotidyl transferase/2'3'-cyclic phosphodiesterase/2'nucleotidase/phosphatase [Casimicrobiaceae bacterium]|nr:multifunctional CCA tRNA nucleotidyl transferase/2'3'-cyclic phosphodiesterase/2'nucleotidase/phosphatase [Casimicrobiaceae bacterium]